MATILWILVAALIAVASSARLEHLERGYLPPDNNNFGTNGFGSNVGSFGNGFNSGSNGLGNGLNSGNGLSNINDRGPNTFGSNGQSSFTSGFGTNGQGSNGQSSTSFGPNGNNGNGGSQGANGFGSTGGTNGFSGSASNQYLPPDQSSSGSGAGFSFGGSSIKPACSSCGQSRFSQQYNQASSSIPGTSYGVPQFGSSFGSNGGSNVGSNFGTNFGSTSVSPGSSSGNSEPADSNSGSFGSSNGNFGSNAFGSNPFGSQGSLGSQSGANRQYLPPRPSSQNPPQQPFDEKYGYFY